MDAIIIGIVLVAYAAFWAIQFAFLMCLTDEDFPGRFDKPLWVATFLLIFPVAPVAFRIWRNASIND